MKTAHLGLILGVFASVAKASPVGLRGTAHRKAESEYKDHPNTTTHQTSGKVNTWGRKLEGDDPWETHSRHAQQAQAGVGVVSSALKLANGDVSWQTGGETLAALGGLAAVSIPPPAGIAVGSFMSIVGGIMGIFGGSSAPTNSDVINAVNSGFEKMENLIGHVDENIRKISLQVEMSQQHLDEILVLTNRIYSNTVLQGERIRLFTQKVVVLSRRLESFMANPDLMNYYTSYLYELADEYDDMQGGVGALSGKNLDAMLRLISAEDYSFVIHSVTLYRWFFQARTSLWSTLMQTSMLRSGNLTEETLIFTDRYVKDVKEYDDVLKRHRLGKTVSFDGARLSKCEAISKPLMQNQGISFTDFMSPYIFLAEGECSRPVHSDEKYMFDKDIDTHVLLDVNESECDASSFWNGRRSSFRTATKDRLYVNYISESGFKLKFEWLKTCPTGINPRVQADNAFLTNPGCGCRVYAPPSVVWDGLFRLSADGKQVVVSTNGQLVARRSGASTTESFERKVHDDGSMSLLSSDGKYVNVDGDGVLWANSDTTGERFDMTVHNGSVSLKSARGQYVSVDSDGWLIANSDVDGPSQKFQNNSIPEASSAILQHSQRGPEASSAILQHSQVTTVCDGHGVRYGDRFVQFGEWRIGDVDGNHLSVSHRDGKTAQIYRYDGKIFPGHQTGFSTWSRSLGAPSGIAFGDRFIQIGEWRIGDVDGTHASVAHRNGKTAEIFRNDGTLHHGPRNDFSTWGRKVGPASGISIGDNFIQIGAWRIQQLGASWAAILPRNLLSVAYSAAPQIYVSNGNIKTGQEWLLEKGPSRIADRIGLLKWSSRKVQKVCETGPSSPMCRNTCFA